MITIAMGTAVPSVPPMIMTSADQKFAAVGASVPDMLLLHRAPAPAGTWTGYG